MQLALIPKPKKMEEREGRLGLPAEATVAVTDARLVPAAERAREALSLAGVAGAGRGVRDPLVISFGEGLKPGGYRLQVAPEGARIEAESPAAARHAAETLAQVAEQSPRGELPGLSIEDWPDFIVRGVYHDLTRGRVPKTERLVAQARTLARFKVNMLQIYLEHTFRFRGHPAIGEGASPLEAADVLELDRACREADVELVPSLASFGHLSNVLTLEPYRHLAEDWGVGRYTSPEAENLSPWVKNLRGWTLSPANPETYEFLDSLFAELLPLFSSDKFNVCCDETWDLGLGQTQALAESRGKGRVYLDHIVKLRDLAAKRGKRIQFWGDIIRKHPELIPEIPKDVTVLDWGYDHNHDFAAIRAFRMAGLEFYACPGTSSWASLFPRLPTAMANIAGFASAAKANGAAGVLNTDWGDGGHYNFMELSWHGYLFGAERSWNSSADPRDFHERFARLFLGTKRKDVARAVADLGDVTETQLSDYYQSIWQHVFFAPAGDPVFSGETRKAWVSEGGRIDLKKIALDATFARDAQERLAPVRKAFAAVAREKGSDPYEVMDYWIFAVDTIAFAAKKLAALVPGAKATAAARRKLARDQEGLMKRFEKLWMARSRRSEIEITLKRYRESIASLAKA